MQPRPTLTSLLLLCGHGTNAHAVPSPSVVLDAGTIIGTTTSLPSSTAVVNKFLGVPFALPPINSRRFKAPEPVKRFSKNPLMATQWSHICIQQVSRSETAEELANEDEDCLYLNIYSPAKPSKSGLPVLAWIHGGGLRNGYSGRPGFDGSSFVVNHDIVVVTFNYRVNVFGFPNSPEIDPWDTNLGFYDQRLALEWVQKNIAAFGGDPKKVTISGESSGAASVDRLVLTMRERAPFRAAITESGQATLSAFAGSSKAGPASWASLVAALKNCTGFSSELECVRDADAVTIRTIINDGRLDFGPVNDNITQMPLPYLNSRAEGSVAGVPYMTGTTAQEGTYLAYQYQLNISTFSDQNLFQYLNTTTGGNDMMIQQFTQLIHSIQQSTGLSLFYAAAQAYTEAVYQCPAKLVSEVSSKTGIPTWRYYYNASFENIHPPGYPGLGATHISDLSMIWGTYSTENATTQEVELSRFMQKAWADFTKDPDGVGPGWQRLGDDGKGAVCLGCNGSSNATVIAPGLIDSLCPYFEQAYATVDTPYF